MHSQPTGSTQNGNKGTTISVSPNSKVLCISGAFSMWDYVSMTMTITVNGSVITCSNNNGTFVDMGLGGASGLSNGRFLRHQLWYNNKQYADSNITNVTVKGTDGDSAISVQVIKG